MTADTCPIWGTPANVRQAGNSPDGLRYEVTASHRAGGNYIITEQALNFLKMRADAEQIKARLSSWVVDQQQPGHPGPEITRERAEEFSRHRPLPVHDRADRLLKYLKTKSPVVGNTIDIPLAAPDHWIILNMLAWSECIQPDPKGEMLFLLEYLIQQDWIKINGGYAKTFLTVAGYARLAKLEAANKESSQGFVAMWFDDTMKSAYIDGIEPGIKDAGYTSLRIDNKEHLNKIDDEIIAEIRRSRFIVADFTEGEKGNRGGVYYEAGFAHGLNIPVIFTCRKDSMDHLHFDTRQFPHIVWNTPDDLRTQLSTRISAVIGDGPHRKQP